MTRQQGDNTSRGRPVVFGEVLFDRFPNGERVLGGAPFNVAWHLQGFGSTPFFISRIGRDEPGRMIRQAMRDWGMDGTGVQTDDRYPTGAVEVSFSGVAHTFDILPDRAYDCRQFIRIPSRCRHRCDQCAIHRPLTPGGRLSRLPWTG